MPAAASALYFGHVRHRRLRPFEHKLGYSVFSVFVDLAELSDLDRRSRWFSHNRWNVLCFLDKDHGPRDGSDLRAWIDARLAEAGIDLAGGPVRILCFPRVFGYVFNPLSVWYCYTPDERLAAVLYEVSNTFGEHHCYLLPVDAPTPGHAAVRQHCVKQFYVSPFIGMAAAYRFALVAPGPRLRLTISVDDADGPLLTATHTGRRMPFRDSVLAKALWAYPLMTLKVIGGIHWEALKMFRKGARPLRRPAPPRAPVTITALPRPAAE